MIRLRAIVPPRKRLRLVALTLILLLVAGLAAVLWPRSQPVKVTAYFTRTVGLYPGSDVRVLGVRIGEVKKITPQGNRVRVDLEYDAGSKVPADAKAAIINSSVVSDRYLQLLPVYRGGPAMRSGAVIPASRTAVPVELDRVFNSLNTVSQALGPHGANTNGSLSRLLSVSAQNLSGQGADLHQMIQNLSQAVTTLSNGRSDLFGTVSNLQVFTAALASDDGQVRAFNNDLAKVAQMLAGDRTQLAAALKQLSSALTDVAGFVRANQNSLTTNVKGLSQVTGVLVKERSALQEILDVAPTGLSNLQNAYNPASGTLDTRNNAEQAQDPASLVCSLLKTTGQGSDCSQIRQLIGSLPPLPQANPTTGLPIPAAGTAPTDRTLGGILGGRA
ncbi:MCE family protein [Actinacidiphila oryziradicis]|uniref:MCE family protein n=1 Tax=Actinacidiphila oryziradicis TaxID=2571141 RepID=UPI0023F492E2|nr:MCE family protein [Actinacidiphila oryziradicis]MCW2875701.1 mammalian cell entry protein [Actinacidiphila oryziradicis]